MRLVCCFSQGGHSADTGADHDTYIRRQIFRYFEPGITHGHLGCRRRELREAVEVLGHAAVHVIGRLKALYLAGKARIVTFGSKAVMVAAPDNPDKSNARLLRRRCQPG